MRVGDFVDASPCLFHTATEVGVGCYVHQCFNLANRACALTFCGRRLPPMRAIFESIPKLCVRTGITTGARQPGTPFYRINERFSQTQIMSGSLYVLSITND